MPSSPSKCHASWEHGSQVTGTENKTQVRIVILYPQFFRSPRLLTLGSIYWTVAVSWRISWWPVDRTAWSTHSPLEGLLSSPDTTCERPLRLVTFDVRHQKYVLWVDGWPYLLFCTGSFCKTITIPPTQQLIIYYKNYNKTLPLFNNPTFLKGIFDLQFAYIITYLERTSIVSGARSMYKLNTHCRSFSQVKIINSASTCITLT